MEKRNIIKKCEEIYQKLRVYGMELTLNASALAASVYLGVYGNRVAGTVTELYGVINSVEPLKEVGISPSITVTGLIALKNLTEYIITGNKNNLNLAIGSALAGIALTVKDKLFSKRSLEESLGN